MFIVSLAASQALPAPPAVWPAAPIAVRGVFLPLRALQARDRPRNPLQGATEIGRRVTRKPEARSTRERF